MTPEVTAAVEEIRRRFSGHTILIGPDQSGGAVVIVEGVAFGAPYAQPDSWAGFHITVQCPYADVYPHFLRGDLSRADGKALGQGFSQNQSFPQPGVVVGNTIAPRPAVQVSRRSNHREPNSELETPLIKLLKVLRWIKSL